MSYLDPVRHFVKILETHDDDLKEKLFDAVIKLHIEKRFSEGYVAEVLGIDRMQVRELKNDQLLPCGHHVSSLGASCWSNPNGSCTECAT